MIFYFQFLTGPNAGSLIFYVVRRSQVENKDYYVSIFSKNGTQINKWGLTHVELLAGDIK